MKHVLITGINGAAGSYLSEYLVQKGELVFGLGRPEFDLTRMEDIRNVLIKVRPDVVYHLASVCKVRESFDKPADYLYNNEIGTVNLFEGLRELGMNPVVQICSTSEVYGDPIHSPIGESWPIQPIQSPYAVSKVGQENIANMYHKCYGFRIVITRAFGYINPRRAALSLTAFARQIALIEQGRQKTLKHGKLDSLRTFCDVRDIVRAYSMATDLGEGVFNIGSEEPISIWQCLEALKSMAKCPIETEIDPALMRPADLQSSIPDCTKFRLATGWTPIYQFKDSLQNLLEYCRSNV